MKKIYILLMQTYTIPARIIKLFTKCQYSHVGISLEKNCQIIYSFGRKKWNSILNSGFSVEHKDGDFFKKFNKTICKIYELEITEEQYSQLKDILYNMENNSNQYKYDYFGLVPRYFGIPFTLKNRYVCSYFIASLLEKTNIHNFEKDIWFITPKDFENIPEFNEIYIGKYLSYK